MPSELERIIQRHGRSDDLATELKVAWEGTLAPDAQETTLYLSHDAASNPVETAERYLDLGCIGQGGMGEVHRVFDRALRRTLAMKVMSARLAEHAESVARFIEEAQATAQLQHPGIVPIHDVGEGADGRPWFTSGTDGRRANRGGGWGSPARNTRCAYRWASEPSTRTVSLGFRLARSVGGEPSPGAPGQTAPAETVSE